MGIQWTQSYLGKFTDTYSFTFTGKFNLNYWTAVDGNDNHPTNTFVAFRTDSSKAPKNTTITCNNSNTITITNAGGISVDEYHDSVKEYVSPCFVVSSDMYATSTNLTKCTINEFKTQVMHYTGKSWNYKGINAYYRDGHRLYFDIPVYVDYKSSNYGSQIFTTSQTFRIECIPNYSPATFKRKYALYNSE